MNKCLKISVMLNDDTHKVLSALQSSAKKLNVEGTAQIVQSERRVKIIACGEVDKVDEFLDVLHKHLSSDELDDLEIEPFLKDRDYRGAFRIIE